MTQELNWMNLETDHVRQTSLSDVSKNEKV